MACACRRYVPQVGEWCHLNASESKCPPQLSLEAAGSTINRKTLGWNAAAASFAYGFIRFGHLGYKLIVSPAQVFLLRRFAVAAATLCCPAVVL